MCPGSAVERRDNFPGSVDVTGRQTVHACRQGLRYFFCRICTPGRDQAIQFLKAIGQALKPGGVLGITDHVGIDRQNNANLHRLNPEIARELLTESGFEIAGSSELFANPDDSHLLMVYDERIYRQTDRFFFRAVKK